MFNLITLNHFLVVAWFCLQCILLQFTALPILHFTPGAKNFTNCYELFPLQNKQFRPWEVCSLDDPWFFAASHSLMHFINQCTWKSSQYYIIISTMTSFMRMSQKLVYHHSKCICAIKRILSSAAMYVSSSFFMYLGFQCYCTAMHASIQAPCVGDWRRYSVQYNAFKFEIR